MYLLPIFLLFGVIYRYEARNTTHSHATKPPANDVITPEMVRQLEKLERNVGSLTRQAMLQQFFVDERVRSEGDSGIKRVRNQHLGSQPYYGATHTSNNLPGNRDTSWEGGYLLLQEVDAVINGVDFRTHNRWFPFKKPDTHTRTVFKTEKIQHPPVPPSVLHKSTLDAQIKELREYFKAFQHQDTRIRDYRPYFKPVLCYLEAYWLNTNFDNHGQEDQRDHIRYLSYTGEALYHGDGNTYSYLPKTIINVTENGIPTFAQWEYRQVCHPIKLDLKLQDFKLVDDIAPRMYLNKTVHDFRLSRAARYVLAPKHGYRFNWQDGYGHFNDGTSAYGLLDRIMAEIPGLDNYPGHAEDNSFEMGHMSMAFRNNTKLNTAFYHRWYKVNRPGAMGLLTRHRGYADANMWVAETTHSNIAAMSVKDCHYDRKVHKNVCHRYTKRMSYALPLEIIWMTPLHNWNPRNLVVHSDHTIPKKNHRNGGHDAHHAYNGTARDAYYITPGEFYFGNMTNRIRWLKGVLDHSGKVQLMAGAGTMTLLPPIEGLSTPIRLRYPIMPIHAEGSTSWKELSALETIMMDWNRYHTKFGFKH